MHSLRNIRLTPCKVTRENRTVIHSQLNGLTFAMFNPDMNRGRRRCACCFRIDPINISILCFEPVCIVIFIFRTVVICVFFFDFFASPSLFQVEVGTPNTATLNINKLRVHCAGIACVFFALHQLKALWQSLFVNLYDMRTFGDAFKME